MYEMVAIAILDQDGYVGSIAKRPVKEWQLLKPVTLLKKFDALRVKNIRKMKLVADPKIADELQKPYIYNKRQWTTFCPYMNPSRTQNLSRERLRSRSIYFSPPSQHLQKGLAHGQESLLTFQALTFSLVWKQYFDIETKNYAEYDGSPIMRSEFHTQVIVMRSVHTSAI